MRHLGEALDAVRKSEYARVQGRQRRYIKGQKYTLLSRRENLTARRQKGVEDIVGRQQTAQHGLCSQGELRPAVLIKID
jgi:hypothetical protein